VREYTCSVSVSVVPTNRTPPFSGINIYELQTARDGRRASPGLLNTGIGGSFAHVCAVIRSYQSELCSFAIILTRVFAHYNTFLRESLQIKKPLNDLVKVTSGFAFGRPFSVKPHQDFVLLFLFLRIP
jgi:hypothetical protein